MLFQQHFVVLYRQNILWNNTCQTHPIRKICLAAYVNVCEAMVSKMPASSDTGISVLIILRKPKRSISERYASASLRFCEVQQLYGDGLPFSTSHDVSDGLLCALKCSVKSLMRAVNNAI